jgi:cytochrome c553
MKIEWLGCAALAATALAVMGALVAPMTAQNSGTSSEQVSGAAKKIPLWAYPVSPTSTASQPDNTKLKHVPGSTVGYTAAHIADRFSVPDWFPDSHPPMPDVVSHGRKPDAFACGYCHLPNGQGRPENASIAGLPPAYIMEQVADFKNGARKSSEPRMASVTHMEQVSMAASEEEVKTAAQYFSSMKLKPWIRVVETNTVPRTRIDGSMLVPTPKGMEPIGERIIEVPEDLERTELRDATSGFVAYVPVGSIKRGEALVTTGGGGKTMQCSACHGADLHGTGNVPSIAGRSPSQMVRQIIDIQTGARNGPGAQLMKPVVNNLGNDDIVNIVAYLTSLKP